MSFLSELKRRNVVRMGVLYVVASWVVLQIADVIFDPLGVPGWVFRLLLSLLALGLPFALIFAWVFELTPDGLKRERDIEPGASIVHETGNRMNIVIVVLLLVAIAGLVFSRMIPAPLTAGRESAATATSEPSEPAGTSGPSAGQGENSIAVLPFVNMSGDPDNEYFSDGLTEELLNSLVKLGGLQVTGRTSSFAFKGQNQDLREIGRLLNVANVLEGSVRKAGNRVRITVQLIKASDGYHLWSETFDRELNDIFAIQAEIAGQVSNALHLALLGPAVEAQPIQSNSTESPVAYEEYLRGMYTIQHDPDDRAALDKARRHFERAIEIDPAYVDAYWGMFNVWDRFNRNGFIPYNESLEQMERYKHEIGTMAPGSDRALDTAARVANVHFEYAEGAGFLQEAVERYPGSANLWSAYAQTLLLLNPLNRPDSSLQARSAAAQAIETSVQLDPLSPGILRIKANWLMQEGQCDELEKLTQRALELDSEIGRFRGTLATCIFATGGDLQQALEIAGQEPLGYFRNTLQAVFHNKLGSQEQAQRHLDLLYLENGDSASYQYGQIFAQWGETDTSLAWLENALLIHDPGIILSGFDPFLDPLRGDPRFEDILAAAGYR